MIEITIPADTESFPEISAAIEEELQRCGCPSKARTEILIACEEVFVNIAHYAYGGEKGKAHIYMNISEADGRREAIIVFSDTGTPYNPLERPDPNVTLPLEERQIGGLGIYMAKKLADSLDYEYENGSNRLAIRKSF